MGLRRAAALLCAAFFLGWFFLGCEPAPSPPPARATAPSSGPGLSARRFAGTYELVAGRGSKAREFVLDVIPTGKGRCAYRVGSSEVELGTPLGTLQRTGESSWSFDVEGQHWDVEGLFLPADPALSASEVTYRFEGEAYVREAGSTLRRLVPIEGHWVSEVEEVE